MMHLLASLLLSGVTVSFTPTAEVTGAEMTLADIATVDGEELESVRAVGAHPLGYAPAPGYSRLIRADRLSAELRRALPDVEVVFTGSLTCRVHPATETIAPERLEQAAREALGLHMPNGSEGEATLRLTTPLAPIQVPRGAAGVSLEAVVDPEHLQGTRTSVPVRVLVDGVPHRTVWTQWSLEVWDVATVPTRRITAGQVIDVSMLTSKRVRRTERVGEKPLDLQALLGKTPVRDLPAGEPVRSPDVARPLLIEQGALVQLRVRNGSLQVTARVEALEGGALGETIRIRMVGREKELSAVVTSAGIVDLDLSTRN